MRDGRLILLFRGARSISDGSNPGVTGLLTSRTGEILPVLDAGANLVDLLGLR